MHNQSQFLQQIKDALHHLYDYSYLEKNPLALQFWLEPDQGGPNRSQQLHRLLLESIEELHPPTHQTRDAPRAEYYFLLVYRYVEEWPLEDIMRELGYSRRQFFRKQQKAIELLAVLLWEKLIKQESQNVEPENVLDDEVERLLSRRKAIDSNEVIQGALEVVNLLAKEHHVTLTYNLDLPLPNIYGSRTLLRQVFLNTLSHLISQPGTRQVRLQVWPETGKVVTEVATESDKNAKQQPLELQSVRRLVERVGGNWQTFKFRPEGCLCRFEFPAVGQKALLVVEDNEGVIRAFRRYLVGYNYQVIGATTGAEALRLAEKTNPAAIILDVMIPNQDGWEILQALKNNPVTQDIPVIICSVLEDPALAHSLGAVAYLQKPVAQADLLATLNSTPGAV